MSKTTTREFTAEERAALLAQFKQSGLSLRAFAQSVGVPSGTFSHWCWRERQAAHDEGPVAEALAALVPTFVPVTLTATAAPSAARYEVLTPRGFVVRVGDDFAPATLQRLLAALEGVSC